MIELANDNKYKEKWIAMNELGEIIGINEDDIALFEELMNKKINCKWLMKKVSKTERVIHKGV